jgi:plasmid stabilization system protein ParE
VSGHVVQIAPGAEGDIADSFNWYAKRNALIADAFRSEVFVAIERIAERPLAKAPDGEGNRRRPLRRFPYSVVYEMRERAVTILAIAHHRRKPGYWRAAEDAG